jgi:hypothetical protein
MYIYVYSGQLLEFFKSIRPLESLVVCVSKIVSEVGRKERVYP